MADFYAKGNMRFLTNLKSSKLEKNAKRKGKNSEKKERNRKDGNRKGLVVNIDLARVICRWERRVQYYAQSATDW